MTMSGQTFLKTQKNKRSWNPADNFSPASNIPTSNSLEEKTEPLKITQGEAKTVSDSISRTAEQARKDFYPETSPDAPLDVKVAENILNAPNAIRNATLGTTVWRDTAGTSNLKEKREKFIPEVEQRMRTAQSFSPIIKGKSRVDSLIKSAETGYETNSFEGVGNAPQALQGAVLDNTFPEQWIDIEGNNVFYSNQNATIKKPVLKDLITEQYSISRMQDAYNGITYNFANNGDMYTVKEIKEYYKERENVPDGVIQQFIYDACSDVQTGKRRSIDKYAEYYPALSNTKGYVTQKDSILQLLTDEDFINYGIFDFLEGETSGGQTLNATKELKTDLGGENLTKLLESAMIIADAADKLNEIGANVTQASDYAIAKSYQDIDPKLKEAINTFDKFNISKETFNKLVGNYYGKMESMTDRYEEYGGEKGLTSLEFRRRVDELVKEESDYLNQEFMNSWNKDRLQGKFNPGGVFTAVGDNVVANFLYGNSYQDNDGKRYNGKGEEIKRDDATVGYVNEVLGFAGNLFNSATELTYDFDTTIEDPSRESVVNMLSDTVSGVFDIFMLTPAGLSLQAQFHIPFYGSILQTAMDVGMDVAGTTMLDLANMTLFADGEWSEKSQQKFKEAAGGLMFMRGMKYRHQAKGIIKNSIKYEMYRSALYKSVMSYMDVLSKGIREIDVTGELAKIEQMKQPEVEQGDNKKAVNEIKNENKVQKIMFMRNVFEKAKQEFNKTFQEELSKSETEPGIIDRLWNTAILLRKGGLGGVEKYKSDTKTYISRWEHQKSRLENKLNDLNNQMNKARGEGNDGLVRELREERNRTEEQLKKVGDKISKLERDLRNVVDVTEPLRQIKEGGENALNQIKEGSKRDRLAEIKEGGKEAIEETKQGFREWGEDIKNTEARVEETPEVKIEETEAGTPIEGADGKIETKEVPQEAKTTISQIFDIMQNILDNSRALYESMRGWKFNREEKQNDKYFKENGFGDEARETMKNNPYTDIILNIIDRFTTNWDKKGNEISKVGKDGKPLSNKEIQEKTKTVTKKKDPSTDEIQREILSEGINRIQKYVDNLNKFRKMIGKLYDSLSKNHIIDVSKFATSEPLTKLLESYGLQAELKYDDLGRPYEVEIIRTDGQRMGNKKDIARYVADFINNSLGFGRMSELELHEAKGDLKWNKSTYGDYDAGFENSMKNAYNAYLDSIPETKMMRELDKSYKDLKDNLDILADLFKNGEVKENAKSKILKWDEKTLKQMNNIIPGLKSLVELAKSGPELVRKGIDAKTTYKKTRTLRGSIFRLTLVGAGSYAAAALTGPIGWLAGSAIWATAERLAVRGKRGIIGQKPDWTTWDKMYDTLKVDGNTRAKLKQNALKREQELSKIFKDKKEKEIQDKLGQAMQIVMDRKANKLLEKKKVEDEIRLNEWNRTQQPIDNALPGVNPDVVTPEGEVTLGRGKPISPELASRRPNMRKPIKEVKETYTDKDKTQQGYTAGEQMMIEASLGKAEGEKVPEDVEKIADILEEQITETENAIKESARNTVEERGEEITEENIEKEIEKGTPSIEDFIMEVEKGAPEESTNYDGADIKTLEEVVANPKKYPNVDIEAAKSALEKARRQNMQAEIMQSPDQQQAQKEIAGIYKGNQMEREGNKGWEKQREDMTRATNRDFDTLETTEEYDRIENQITPEEGELATKYANGYKGFYRSDKTKTDLLLEDMGKGPSQNITYTSSSDKIATLKSPVSRKRVATKRINDKVDPAIKNAKSEKTRQKREDEKTALNQIIEQADIEIQTKEELKAQKTELANEYKALEKKRSETPYRENKREYTKQMDKISDEFDKLTYEEAGKLFSKPKEVEAEEIKEAERIEDERQNLDENETPQKAEPEIKKQETKKESEGERSFGDEEYTERDDKIEKMSKDENITIKDTINEVDEIIGGGIKDYQEKIYGEDRDKEESYTNDGAESFRNKFNDKIGERDRKFWEDQRSKTKDMESTKLTKEQEKQLEEAKTKEEKDALMNKWRKEYIERNPIAEKYLKEAEEHNKQFQKAMDALGKIDAIVRRIRRKNAEKITRAYEERKKKRAEEERQNLDMNETPQIDEIPQEVSSEKITEGKQETSVEELFGRQPKQEKIEKPVTSEKTSTYEWKGKQNMEEFEKKFENDPEDRYTDGVDEYGEVVGQPKEVKLRNYVQDKFGKVDRSSSAFRDSQYDEELAMATEIINTNISYKDINVKYYKDTGEMKSDKGTSETAKAYFDRDNVQMGIGDPNYKYSPLHEVQHGLDYKFAKELGYDGDVGLSRIVEGDGFKPEGKHKELLQRFQNLMNDMIRKATKIKGDKIQSPDEIFARFGEAFGQRAKGDKIETSAGDYFGRDTNLFQRYADWLSDIADAREKGDLDNGTLQKIEGAETNEFNALKVEDEKLKSDIEWIRNTKGYPEEFSEKKVIQKASGNIPKGKDSYKATAEDKKIYQIKQDYIEDQIRRSGTKIIDFGDVQINNPNNINNARTHTVNGKEIRGTVAFIGHWSPHVVGDAYKNLKRDGFIVSEEEYRKRKENG